MTNILVIEDEAILRDEVVQWLILEDYEAEGATDGMDGVNKALQNLPDLIICDITMPRLDGYGVLLELKAHRETSAIPFIFVTARAAHEDVRRGMEMGADDYISKPFSRIELLRAVETRLAKKNIELEQHQLEIAQWQQAFDHEREQRLMKARLVAMFSHDFRNPLASIIASNALVRDYADRIDADRRLAHMNRIEASAHRLMQMLEDTLVIAQMDVGALKYHPVKLNIRVWLQNLIEEFQIIHNETHTLNFTSQLDCEVMFDPRLLRQIASNLISNAVKYSPQGGDVNTVLAKDDGKLSLTVQDEGIGIPEEDRIRLFEAFQRASNVGRVVGTGLGLAIVKQAVDLHGGVVHIESQVDKGTTVTVKIPI